MTALRELREAAGVPRIVLADRAGVSPFRLYQAEAGRCDLTASERARIDRVIGPELDKVVRTAEQFERRKQEAVEA